jgi:hypothetical protein
MPAAQFPEDTMITNPAVDQLRAAGQALYGPDWQSPLARDLGSSPRMMRFWLAEQRTVPPQVLARLPDIMLQAAAARRRAARDLERLAASLS